MRVHRRVVKLRANDLAFLVDLHVADHAEALDFGIERADAVRKRLRQHRHDEAGEIGRRAAVVGFDIQRRADGYVMRDVGDRNDQAETAALQYLGVNSIVEVTRILAVDGDNRQLADIRAALALFGGDLGFHFLGLAHDLRRPFVRQVVAGDGHFHDERRLQALTQYGANRTHRATMRGRRIGDLGDDDLAGAGTGVTPGGNHDVLVQAAIVRLDQGHAGLDDHAAPEAR